MTAGGALAAPGDAGKLPTAAVKSAQRALDVQADGVVGPKTRRAIRRYQRSEGLRVDGVLGPATLRSLGVGSAGDDEAPQANAPPQASADANGGEQAAEDAGSGATATDIPEAPTADQQATLDRIARCESGGDPTAISPTGRYRGKYQFDRSTWEHMGGTGDPAAAPEAEQDARAAQLLARRGTAPWPVCG